MITPETNFTIPSLSLLHPLLHSPTPNSIRFPALFLIAQKHLQPRKINNNTDNKKNPQQQLQ